MALAGSQIIRFTLRQLEALVAVADAGSVSAAAERLHISQAAVSSLLAALENALRISLLRSRRGARANLTGEASQLLLLARRVLEQARDLEMAADRLKTSTIREIRIGARPYLMDRWLKDAVVRLEHETRSLTVAITRGTNDEIIRQVIDGQLSAGFVMLEEGTVALPSRRLTALSVGLFVGSNHPLAVLKEPTLAQIAAAGFIMPPFDTPLEQRVATRLQAAGLNAVQVVARTEYAESLKLMTIAGTGIGLMFTKDVAAEIESGQLVPLPLFFPPVEIRVIWQGCINGDAQTVVDYLSRHIDAPVHP